ncbi:MAG: hypothetical protein M0000_06375 [Actinomycetota bacterium]|nr:hypothetical protein [Actinomycetota bacterium]
MKDQHEQHAQRRRDVLVLLFIITVLTALLLAFEWRYLDQQRQIGELTLQVQTQRQFLDDLGFKQSGFPNQPKEHPNDR